MAWGPSRSSLLFVLAVACNGGDVAPRPTDSGASDATPFMNAGGRSHPGGAPTTGGATSTGASSTGGRSSTGGASSTGGRSSTGGASTKAGTSSTGGASSTGGRSSTGGASANAGTSSTGGTAGADGGADAGVSYTTDFDTTESPIAEGGAWHHDGLDWTLVDSANGVAFGTQSLGVTRSGPTQYNDSYAYLAGFPPDHRASAVIHLGTIDSSCTHEVEILLRWADSAHVARGYECNVAFDGSYAQIVRWNGAVGAFTYLNSGSVPGGVHDGDTVSASIVGDQITLSVNGTVRASAQDSTFTTGNPGIGFWRGSSGCGSRGDYGFTRYSASAAQ